jgi:hypothetical protein
MNNRYALLISGVLLSWPLAYAFEDKPALTRAEFGLKIVARQVGVSVGSAVGALAGKYTGGTAGVIAADKTPYLKEKVKRIHSGVIVGAAVGGAIGIYPGYKAGGFVALHALAKYHGVSYTEEMVSQFYNINLSQYGRLLDAAHSKANFDYLNELINNIYTQRFGADWKERLVILYANYGDKKSLLSKSYFAKSKSQDEKDFVRMMELGAAMANLYFKSKPQVKTIIANATKMYQKLGLL